MTVRVRAFLTKAWVFLTAAGAGAASTALLTGVIRAARAGNHKLEWQDTPAVSVSGAPDVSSRPEPEEAPTEPPYDAPEFLLVFNETVSDMPSAKDIDLWDAADMAAKQIYQCFNADLEGEICNASYYDMSGVVPEGPGGRGSWMFEFGDVTPGTRRYIIQIDSISGEAFYLYWYVNREADLADYDTYEAVVQPEDFESFLSEVRVRSRRLAEAYFAGSGNVVQVDVDVFGEGSYAGQYWPETMLGYAPSVFAYVRLDNGTDLQLYYSAAYGELVEVTVITGALTARAGAAYEAGGEGDSEAAGDAAETAVVEALAEASDG
jgi:hypothetical protein